MSRPVIPIAAQTDADPGFSAPPLSLYVHIPWCVRKCPYCDFNSHELRGGELPQAQYVDALIADLESALPQIWGRPVSSIFIGGGTPSLFAPETYDTLLAAIRARISLLPGAEITLEANPGTVEAGKFEGFSAAGINRISIGIQSFDDAKLHALGRIHSADEARRAIEIAQRHFGNINLDLMYALPEQSLAQARRDIATAISFGTAHLSAYHLTLEPNTLFHHAPPPLPGDDLSADMQEMVEETLAHAGYEHYETSAFAKPHRRCEHNLNYWRFGDYLGIGAGAHGKITSAVPPARPLQGGNLAENGATLSGRTDAAPALAFGAGDGGWIYRVVREARRKHPADYLRAAARGEFALDRREVKAAELSFEFLMNALRLSEGFPPRLYAERTGLALVTIAPKLLKAQSEGLLSVSAERIAPTLKGQRYLNSLLRDFLPE